LSLGERTAQFAREREHRLPTAFLRSRHGAGHPWPAGASIGYSTPGRSTPIARGGYPLLPGYSS
jgi:hypothetical protein